ncbi:MAG: hypothetical protein KBT88_15430 [Gammaproteobacteria bacterium]|nr:hypothetical protein [Gammaproteobacteria bacterium]MBQ0841172.1 hypothetical protein [Gammaproteobacteria bacterium]
MTQENNTLNKQVITHTLRGLGCYSQRAENLLLATIVLQGQGNGSANHAGIGLYQIDEASHRQVWDHYLAFDPDLASAVRGLASQKAFLQDPHIELASNLAYATAIAWMIYQSRGLELPSSDNGETLTQCWAKYFVPAAKPVGCKPNTTHYDIGPEKWRALIVA